MQKRIYTSSMDNPAGLESEGALMNDCSICKVINGQTTSFILYEDEDILAYLSSRPYRPGATTIVPKKHVDNFFDIPDEISSRIVSIARLISKNIKANLQPRRVSYLVNGFSVGHAHLRLIPTNEKTDVAHAVLLDGLKPLSDDLNKELQEKLSLSRAKFE